MLLEGDIGVCGIAVLNHFFENFNIELRYCGIFWTCGMHFLSILGGIKNYRLTLFRLGGGGLIEPPLWQNRDNSYTERAMTFKFSDFS